MDSNEPSHQQIIEAHLHLLLDGYESSDVVAALNTIVHTRFNFLRLVRVEDLNTLYNQINNMSHQSNTVVQTVMGTGGTFGRSMMHMLQSIKDASERVSICTSNALVALSRIRGTAP